MEKKQFSITADDYGAHDIIDKGIMEATLKNSVDNIDCMVTLDRSKDALQKLFQEFQPQISSKKLSVGLHLSLTCGKPASMSSGAKNFFCDTDGTFKLLPHMEFWSIDLDAHYYKPIIREELEGQLAKFIEFTEVRPAHISCHSGICHLNKTLSEVYFGFCADNKIQVRNPLLISRLKAQEDEPNVPNTSFKEDTLMYNVAVRNGMQMLLNDPFPRVLDLLLYRRSSGLYKTFTDYLSANPPLKSTDYFIDNFFGNGTFGNLSHIVDSLFDGSSEMVVHPISQAEVPSEVPKGISATEFPYRFKEYQTLTQKMDIVQSLLDLLPEKVSRFNYA